MASIVVAEADATARLNLAGGDVEMFIKGFSRMRTTGEFCPFHPGVDKTIQSWYNIDIYMPTHPLAPCAQFA